MSDDSSALPRSTSSPQPVVLKFGGTSVRTASRWATVATVAESRLAEGLRPVVVCSAIGKTSDHLERLLSQFEDPAAAAASVEALREDHWELAADLGVEPEPLLSDVFEHLTAVLESARVLGEIPPRTRALVMSVGELLSTRLGAAWMKKAGLPAHWQDARQWLLSERQATPAEHYLSATCSYERSETLRREVLAEPRIVVTQGFIARDDAGDTVLLGRGGSDTSAAYLAAILGAARLEIWTDVPGMFSTDPRDVPEARILRHLSWTEAEALATLGAGVLHPRCIGPVREARIPVHVRATPRPELPGTRIGVSSGAPALRAVGVRSQLSLVTMKRPPSWQEVGFLADVTACFQRHGLSVDLLSTSPGRICATVDRAAAPHADEALPALVRDLGEVCEAELDPDVASVSVVGTRLREMLPQIGAALRPLQDAEVGMVSQGASDTHLTFVVPREAAVDLAGELHAALLSGLEDPCFGECWNVLYAEKGTRPPERVPEHEEVA